MLHTFPHPYEDETNQKKPRNSKRDFYHHHLSQHITSSLSYNFYNNLFASHLQPELEAAEIQRGSRDH